MTSLAPSSKTTATYAAGVIVGAIQVVLARHGYSLPADIALPLTGLITAIVPHVWEVIMGQDVTGPKP